MKQTLVSGELLQRPDTRPGSNDGDQIALLHLLVDESLKCSSCVNGALKRQGKIVDNKRHITYVWLLEYDDFVKFQQDGEAFFYTLDAGRSTAALYSYRPGVLGANLIDVGIELGRADDRQNQR